MTKMPHIVIDIEANTKKEYNFPGKYFSKLYEEMGISKEKAIEDWSTLIYYKNKDSEEIENTIEEFMKFYKNALGRNIDPEFFDIINTYLDHLNELGINIDFSLPQCDWVYSDHKKERLYEAYNRKLNNAYSYIYTVEQLLDQFPAYTSKNKLKKKELISILEEMKKDGIILEYEKRDIYCGEPQYKKRKYFDYEFNEWWTYYEEISPEKTQGNSYQKNKKTFRICADEMFPAKIIRNHFWKVDYIDWERNNPQ